MGPGRLSSVKGDIAMSQKKVDQYKEQKANRSEIMKKEKRTLMIEKIIGGVVTLLVVCWVLFSVYNKLTAVDESTQEVVTTAMDTTAIDNFVTELSSEGEEAEETVEEEAAEEETETAEEAEETVEEETAEETTEEAAAETAEEASEEPAEAEETAVD